MSSAYAIQWTCCPKFSASFICFFFWCETWSHDQATRVSVLQVTCIATAVVVEQLIVWNWRKIIQHRSRISLRSGDKFYCILLTSELCRFAWSDLAPSHKRSVRMALSRTKFFCSPLKYCIIISIDSTRQYFPYSIASKVTSILVQALRVLRGWVSQISRQSTHKCGQIVSIIHRPPLPPGYTPGTNVCWRLSRPQ